MDDVELIQARNRALADRINEEARRDPSSPYAGKFVGIANGEVVVVSENWDEVSRRLREADPENRRSLWLEASADYDTVEYV